MKKRMLYNLPLWGLFSILTLLIVYLAFNGHSNSFLAVGVATTLYFFSRNHVVQIRSRLWITRMDTIVLAVILIWIIYFSICWNWTLIQQHGLIQSFGNETDLSSLIVVSLLAASLVCFTQEKSVPNQKN